MRDGVELGFKVSVGRLKQLKHRELPISCIEGHQLSVHYLPCRAKVSSKGKSCLLFLQVNAIFCTAVQLKHSHPPNCVTHRSLSEILHLKTHMNGFLFQMVKA